MQLDAFEEEARAFQYQYASRAPSVSPSWLASDSVTASDSLPEGLSKEDRDIVKSIVTKSTSARSSSGGQLQFDSVKLDELEAAALSFRNRRHSGEGDRRLKESK
jgi:alpha-ketoglutarate-dependent taurine dioxygenase